MTVTCSLVFDGNGQAGMNIDLGLFGCILGCVLMRTIKWFKNSMVNLSVEAGLMQLQDPPVL